MFDPKSKASIYNYAIKLIGLTFRDVQETYIQTRHADFIKDTAGVVRYEDFARKGGLGELLELMYFHYEPDNIAQPDFVEAGVELKVTPYKINKNKTISAKERLVISMINYHDIVNVDFYDSTLYEKIKDILLVYYLYEEEKERLDYQINYVYLYSPTEEDLKIIVSDYLKIQQKVQAGRAHELSESDTLYLGAVTKASTSADRTTQPYSEVSAKPRAFTLKTSFMTALLREEISSGLQGTLSRDEVLASTKVIIEDSFAKVPQQPSEFIKIEGDEDFEVAVKKRLDSYRGKTQEELSALFYGEQIKAKNILSVLTYKMLGLNSTSAAQFERANVKVKTIRLNEHGRIVESMSFPTFKVNELINEKWETSTLYEMFSETRFLFVVFKKEGNTYKLHSSMFWNMPYNDLEVTVKKEWENVVNIFNEGVKLVPVKRGNSVVITSNLPKLSNSEIIHVRNHSVKSFYVINNVKYGNGQLKRDGDVLPNGDIISKQCFWLNNHYILKELKKEVQIA